MWRSDWRSTVIRQSRDQGPRWSLISHISKTPDSPPFSWPGTGSKLHLRIPHKHDGTPANLSTSPPDNALSLSKVHHDRNIPYAVARRAHSRRLQSAPVPGLVKTPPARSQVTTDADNFACSKSTDFEVHRNWLAITNSLPVSEWYYEKTSEWTLDYPPFFAYFEWVLSHVAKLVDPAMVRVFNLEHDSWQTIYFQRTTVILTELVLVFALQLFIESSPLQSKRAAQVAALSIILSPGLLIIDHIHFQYNGFMYGILIWSLVLARCKSTLLSSGLVFAALLCFKHIYLYLAPAYFVFLLRTYCLSAKSVFRIRFFNCIKLGGGVGAIFVAAFGPFAAMDQISQMMSRLFPFSRGLCHAYWAPNIWAMYSFTDRVLIHRKLRAVHKNHSLLTRQSPRALV